MRANRSEWLLGTTPHVVLFSLLIVVGLLPACGGGPVGGGSGNTGAFVLSNAFFARPIFDVNGQLADIVNPASLFEVDALTGVPLDGFPKPLSPGQPLTSLVSFNFEQVQDPLTPQVPLIPRNAVVVLEFTTAVMAASLLLESTDPDNPNKLSALSPIQALRKDGTKIPVRAWVQGKRVILSAILSTTSGWQASPLTFDALGNVVEDPTGNVRVVVNANIGAPLLASNASPLKPRDDLLGTTLNPLPFNPGNSQLDAIQLQNASGTVGFNGFLPDLSAPRIVRPVELTGTITSIGASLVGPDVAVEIVDSGLAQSPNVTANEGLGEWANSLMEITSAGDVVTRYVVLDNFDNALPPGSPTFRLEPGIALAAGVVPGDSYRLVRTEYFEPIPPPLPVDPVELAAVTVDPGVIDRDPNDPQDSVNHDLRYFLNVYDENDAALTDVWSPLTGTFLPIPPRSKVGLQFNESMDPDSFHPYESFYVTDFAVQKDDAAFLDMRVGVIATADNNRQIRFSPFLEDQFEPAASAFIGFGGSPSSLKLVMRTLPEQSDIDALTQSVSTDQLDELSDLGLFGVKGITDLGGRGLGLPRALLDAGDPLNFLLASSSVGRGPFSPAVDFEVVFQTQASEDPDYGVIVHRFMGQPTTAAFSPPVGEVADTVQKGIEYYDFPAETDQFGQVTRRFVYGPQLLDLGLNIPGWLSGAPAAAIEHLIDDFNKPKASEYASPVNQDFLTSLGFGVNNPVVAPFGARFQHLYRAGDASPAWFDFKGVSLDLIGLAWSPLLNSSGGGLISTTIDSFEILVGLASTNKGLGPNTNQSNGIPSQGNSGMREHFDCNLLEWAENCCNLDNIDLPLKPFVAGQPSLTTVVKEGSAHSMQASQLFTPANAAGKSSGFNPYLNYPAFNAGVDPFFGNPNPIGFPYDSRFPMLIEYRLRPNLIPQASNVYRFSPGILTSVLPRFRTWTQGQDPLAWGVPNMTIGQQQNNNWRAGNGGPLIEPGGTLPSTAQNGQVPGLPIPPGFGPQFPSPPFGNGQPPIPLDPDDWNYILPPNAVCFPVEVPAQKVPDENVINYPGNPPPVPLPHSTANSDPDMAFYFATGDLAYPVPNLNCYPGPAGSQPTSWYGYGGTFNTGCVTGVPIYPNYALRPGQYGDNSRYYMLWRYRKRVSVIESPSIEARSLSGKIRYLRPLLDPPLADLAPGAGLTVEFRASSLLDFAVPILESGYLTPDDPNLSNKLSGVDNDRTYIKFRASMGVATGKTQGPSLDSVVIPYEKLP